MLNLTSSHILYPISKAYIQDSTSYPLDAQRFQSLGILSNGETTEQVDLDTLLRAWERREATTSLGRAKTLIPYSSTPGVPQWSSAGGHLHLSHVDGRDPRHSTVDNRRKKRERHEIQTGQEKERLTTSTASISKRIKCKKVQEIYIPTFTVQAFKDVNVFACTVTPGMSEIAACPPISYPSALPSPTSSPSSSQKLFLPVPLMPALYTSCCPVLLYFSRYYPVRLKMFYLCIYSLCIICVKSTANLLWNRTT